MFEQNNIVDLICIHKMYPTTEIATFYSSNEPETFIKVDSMLSFKASVRRCKETKSQYIPEQMELSYELILKKKISRQSPDILEKYTSK